MAYSQGWVTPAYFVAFYPTVAHGTLVNHQSIAPGGSTMGGDYIAPLKATHIDMDGALRRGMRSSDSGNYSPAMHSSW